MDIQQNMALFRDLVLCDGIFSWCYGADGALLSSNCPDEAMLATAFQEFGCLEKMQALSPERDTPVFLSSATGLVWGAVFEKEDGALARSYVIGPVYYSTISADAIYRGLASWDHSRYGLAWLSELRDVLARVPTSQYTIFSRYLRMLHYCVTGQRIEISDLFMEDVHIKPAARKAAPTDRHRVYTTEKAMLRMVQLGDLNYREALSASMMISDGVKVSTRDPLQSAKVSTVVFCSIVCRAAIEGGLSPDAAYSLGDAYIQSGLDAHTIDETSTICMTMYDDFIRRVHRTRENPKFSEPIRRCCNYIEMNIDRNIHAQELADLVGYSVTYFTRRFREETGFGISDYVKVARIERAKLLLETSDRTVQAISDQLGFTTRNYFTRCFREVTGLTPAEYRKQKEL